MEEKREKNSSNLKDNMFLVDNLVKEGWLKTPEIIRAFRKIKRVDFLPEDHKSLAELDHPLPIGFGQTISQPLVVAFMLELLEPKPGEKILDVGAGSGWTATLLAHCVSQEGNPKFEIRNPKPRRTSLPRRRTSSLRGRRGRQIQKGKIIAIEVIPELMEIGKKNVSKYNFIKKGVVEFVCADGSKGWKEEAPYDKILCSASAQKALPTAWKEQVKIGGRIVAPILNSIWLFEKRGEGEFSQKEFPGFSFVPLIEE